jgi:hypothetical protein
MEILIGHILLVGVLLVKILFSCPRKYKVYPIPFLKPIHLNGIWSPWEEEER